MSTPSKGRGWAWAALVLGLLLVGGAMGELASVLMPGVLPSEAATVPFMAKHHTEPGLKSWVVASNVVNGACAVAFVIAARRALRGQASGWRLLERSALVLMLITLCSAAVSGWYLFPLPTPGDPAREPTETMAVIMALAVAWLTIMTALLRSAARARWRFLSADPP
jgi:hypothetical protein